MSIRRVTVQYVGSYVRIISEPERDVSRIVWDNKTFVQVKIAEGGQGNRMKYRFKPNKRAKEATIYQQMDKVVEEATEALSALHDMESDDRVSEELLDCIWACEGALRKIRKHIVEEAERRVVEKAEARGDV